MLNYTLYKSTSLFGENAIIAGDALTYFCIICVQLYVCLNYQIATSENKGKQFITPIKYLDSDWGPLKKHFKTI